MPSPRDPRPGDGGIETWAFAQRETGCRHPPPQCRLPIADRLGHVRRTGFMARVAQAFDRGPGEAWRRAEQARQRQTRTVAATKTERRLSRNRRRGQAVRRCGVPWGVDSPRWGDRTSRLRGRRRPEPPKPAPAATPVSSSVPSAGARRLRPFAAVGPPRLWPVDGSPIGPPAWRCVSPRADAMDKPIRSSVAFARRCRCAWRRFRTRRRSPFSAGQAYAVQDLDANGSGNGRGSAFRHLLRSNRSATRSSEKTFPTCDFEAKESGAAWMSARASPERVLGRLVKHGGRLRRRDRLVDRSALQQRFTHGRTPSSKCAHPM